MTTTFWKSVRELAAMRESIPAERREGSAVRDWYAREERRIAEVKKDLADNRRRAVAIMADADARHAKCRLTPDEWDAVERALEVLADEAARLQRWIEPHMYVPEETLRELRGMVK